MSEDGTWQQYQEDAASLFNRLGHEVVIEVTVPGARANHVVDVYVKGQIGGTPFSWVIECKAWKSRIPKEKVLALYSVVQDVGADRGFLLSETGFQSGAIDAARNTNITLTSLDEIINQNLHTLQMRDSQRLRDRLSHITGELTKLHKSRENFCSSEFSGPIDKISYIVFALEDGYANKYPNVYTINECGDRNVAYNWNDLYLKCNALLDQAEAIVLKNKSMVAT